MHNLVHNHTMAIIGPEKTIIGPEKANYRTRKGNYRWSRKGNYRWSRKGNYRTRKGNYRTRKGQLSDPKRQLSDPKRAIIHLIHVSFEKIVYQRNSNNACRQLLEMDNYCNCLQHPQMIILAYFQFNVHIHHDILSSS